MLDHVTQLYQHRGLLEILVLKELKARYRGTVLGFLWSFVNPLVLMLIYVLIFSIYLRMDMPNYPAFLLSGIFPWTWFSLGISDATNSIISNGGLIKKVYLPSEIFPLVYIASNMIHYVLSLPIQLLVLFYFHVELSWPLISLPILLLLQLTFMYGFALVLSALAVQFRDLLHIVPNILMLWFFLTPIFYASAFVPPKYKLLLDLNPMAHLIRSYQAVFYYDRFPSVQSLVILAVLGCLLLAVGFSFFETQKDLFAEEV